MSDLDDLHRALPTRQWEVYACHDGEWGLLAWVDIDAAHPERARAEADHYAAVYRSDGAEAVALVEVTRKVHSG